MRISWREIEYGLTQGGNIALSQFPCEPNCGSIVDAQGKVMFEVGDESASTVAAMLNAAAEQVRRRLIKPKQEEVA